MSNLVHEEEMAVDGSGAEAEKQSPSLGDVGEIRPVPRITLQAFCETDQVADALNAAADDRRMAKAHVKVNMGGISAAAEFYEIAPTPNLIVVESMLSGDDLMADLARLANNCDGETKVVVVGHKNDITLYRQLVSSGVSEYLVAPLSMADVMNTVSEIFVNPEKGALGKIVAFIGAKGGVGSSTICHNVAWSISNNFKSDVMLADLDLAFGTANINLDQDPTMGIADAVFSPDRVDDILLDRLLAKCAEHLSLLAAPSTLERTYDFDPNAFTNVLDVAQRSTPVVAVDLPHQWNGWTKQVLSSADEVVIVACPELANLRNTKNLLDTIMDLRPNDDAPRLVMNQVGVPKRPEIAIPDFVGPLGIEPSAIIPFDPALFGTASNNGQMISEADAKHPTAEIFDVLGQILTGKAELKTEKKSALGFFSKLKRKRG
ncbi:MAG: CpaE family protein [Rhizobiaceae bacterium]|nr:CpaE family protein [Rhizobiaceae bacterium]